MRISIAAIVLGTCATFAAAAPAPQAAATTLPPVQSNKLRRVLLRSELLKKANILQDFAYATPDRNRVIGSAGLNSTIKYLYDTFAGLSDYYSVYLQPFALPSGASTFKVNGVTYESQPMTFGPAGHPVAPLIAVANTGCDASDYPATLTGGIALVSRGGCTFAVKTLNAAAAGAVGTVVYNNVEGVVAGTLGEEGTYVPTIGISQADGLALVAAIAAGTTIGDEEVVITTIYTNNVIAQTKGGDPNNVLQLGGHIDSVEAGPGINDNGSGSLGIFEVALQLTAFSVKNAIRFSFWSGEEEGLVGSTYYVDNLPVSELQKIRLYLNFDMIASPNFVYSIYDGDGSAFGTSGAPGSAEVEKLFEDYLTNDAGLPHVASEFDGRSDYGPFLDVGIACGGLDAGADGVKTVEEQKLFGGTANITYDPNYHSAKDTVSNLNVGAWIQNTKGVAHAVATYGTSWDGFPPNEVSLKKRDTTAASGRLRAGGKYLY